jgi:pre-rRNA-processing protein TSR4
MAGFEAATEFEKLGLAKETVLLSKEEAEALQEDDTDSDDEDEAIVETEYQLGFIEEGLNALHHEEDWREWDGGKVGGLPVWLNPAELPAPETMLCATCEEPMKFLLQIYCPLDDIDAAFHRSMYVFCCKKSSCVSEGRVLVLRTQLPKVNPYYALDPGSDLEVEKKAALAPVLPKLCGLCGCAGRLQCTKCKSEHYCCKSHQKLHWKHHKESCGQSDLTDFSTDEVKWRWLFKEYDLAVSCEELVKDSAAAIESSTTIWEDARAPADEQEKGKKKEEEDEDEDLKLTQNDYNEALGNESRDPEYIRFLSRVRRGGPNQVLRYCRWQDEYGPISISTAAARAHRESVPPVCQRCGAARKFEFQIMPQLLSYLHVDGDTSVNNPTTEQARMGVAMNAPQPADFSQVFFNKHGEDLDWGTIDVYTCSESCTPSAGGGGGGGYACEYARVVNLNLTKSD